MSEPLLKVEHLKKYFPIKGGVFQRTVGYVKAVEDVTLELNKGETFGLVGESGCGKSTAGRTILRLYEKTDGIVRFKGKDVFALKKSELRRMRQNMQIVFQDPYSSLNPRMTVGGIIGEPLLEHGLCTRDEQRGKVLEIMERCGLLASHIDRYPHEFSGGQRQRIGIARALAMGPEFIVCDEPVSALDVSIQAQIINLLSDLQKELQLSFLFISHDLSVVRHISHRIGVMYLGALIETANKDELYDNPVHPYTRALLSAVPIPDPTVKRNRIILPGDLPSPVNPPAGCKFHTRCPSCREICKTKEPPTITLGDGHTVVCHFAREFSK
ncbi:ABC transporter ATP-binding protein [Ethanoligenens harbinense]|uniref:ABC transporter ATP-binding protein n=1 Tax=Ethanoligenens harbinense TaxID=253239 RepID=UPI000EA161F3|nr:dipeptide ABC transporter ATP-binding protein [Ethanoligenens harbinense]AYF41763.1 peptide ABC transporter substrate-binding protein [Ethanoligenens harbinense]